MARDPNELGALWSKTGKKGEYLTGTIQGVSVVCFKNDRKTGNQPDWRVLKSVRPTSQMPATDDDPAF